MKLKEHLYNLINNMNTVELILLYEQIKLLENIKYSPSKKKKVISIEKIHEMASSSKNCWSDAVIEGREDRI